MPDIFTDPTLTLYLIPACVAVAIGFFAFRAPAKKTIIPLGVTLLLLALLGLTDLIFESAREQAQRKVEAMASSSQTDDLDEMFSHVSEEFRYRSRNKSSLRSLAEQALRNEQWQGATVWEFARENFSDEGGGTYKIGFLVKGIGYAVQLYCVATFRKEADGELRLIGFEFFNPLQRDNAPPETIPGL